MNKKIYENVIGLTGIMGSGKSTVAKILSKYGFGIIDADELARFILTPAYEHSPKILKKIKEQFESLSVSRNSSPLVTNNLLDRVALGKLVFSDKVLLQKLNRITHPYIYRVFKQKKNKICLTNNKPIIYDVPLLYENGLDKYLAKNIVVYAPEALAIKRAAKRTGLSENLIKDIIHKQISIEKKKLLADYVIYNTGLKKEIEKQVLAVIPLLS